MPARDDIDPTQIRSNVGRMHILEVEGLSLYRYRIYGSAVTNPDRRDMTGKTTRDYEDQGFARLVTAHMDEAYTLGQPTCYQIDALMLRKPYPISARSCRSAAARISPISWSAPSASRSMPRCIARSRTRSESPERPRLAQSDRHRAEQQLADAGSLQPRQPLAQQTMRYCATEPG